MRRHFHRKVEFVSRLGFVSVCPEESVSVLGDGGVDHSYTLLHKVARNDCLEKQGTKIGSEHKNPELALLRRRSKSLAASLSLTLSLSHSRSKNEALQKLCEKLFIRAHDNISVIRSKWVKPLTPIHAPSPSLSLSRSPWHPDAQHTRLRTCAPRRIS